MNNLSNRLFQPRLPERSLEILNGVLFAVTLVAALTGYVRHVPWWAAALVAALLVLVYVIVAFSRYYSTYTFDEDSPEMCRFFTEWYKRQGYHTIFCDNLDWMAGGQNTTIREALASHGAASTICLRDCSGPVFDELNQAGVSMRQIRGDVHMRAKISIKLDDGLGQMIVRISGRDNDDKVRFRRVSDSLSTEMAREFVVNSSVPI